MTASITQCCRNALEALAVIGRRGRLLAGIGLVVFACAARAGTIEPVQATITGGEDGSYRLTAEFDIDLGSHLEDAVTHGVPLYFNLEFELTRPRWYWINEHIAGKTIVHRLSYSALTRQYRLSSGALHQNFPTIAEALQVLSHIVVLHVVDKASLKSGATYEAVVRLSLDRSQLPKPFQVDAISNRDWQVDTRVFHWEFVPPDKNVVAPESK